MRTCRDLGFAGLREFKLALAQALALGNSPLHRRVSIDDWFDRRFLDTALQRQHLQARWSPFDASGDARGLVEVG